MNYGKEIKSIVEAHVANMGNLDNEARKVEQQRRAEKITGKFALEQKKALEDRRAAAFTATIEKITETHRQHDKAVDQWNSLSAEKLHPDAELLKMDIPMSQTQYQQLVSKHRDNSLMLSLLAQYADRHRDEPLFADRPLDPTARKAEFADYAQRAVGVCRNYDSIACAMFLDGLSVPASVMCEY